MFGLFKKKKEPTRKERSEAILKEHGIKINFNLPNIEAEEDTTIRTPQAVAERMTILALTNMVAFNGITGEQAKGFVAKAQLEHLLTPKEVSFLDNPTDDRKNQETWKCEGIWVLAWALKFIDDLEFPDHLCELTHIPQEHYPIGPGKNPHAFIKGATELRSKKEIMDMNDLYYRFDWACVDARINGQTMEKIHPGVVYERHYALNWLINYMGQDWDDVSCDT